MKTVFTYLLSLLVLPLAACANPSSSSEFDLETAVSSFTSATSYRYTLTVERYNSSTTVEDYEVEGLKVHVINDELDNESYWLLDYDDTSNDVYFTNGENWFIAPHQWEDINFDPQVHIGDLPLDATMIEQDNVETRTFNVKDEGLAVYEKYATLMGSYEYTQVDVQKVSFHFTSAGVLYEVQMELFTDALDLIISYEFSGIGSTMVTLPLN